MALGCNLTSFSPDFKADFVTKLPYQSNPGGSQSSYFCRLNRKIQIEFASYYGGVDLKGRWNLSNICLSSTDDLFITGSFDGLTTDNCKYVPMDSTLLPLKNEASFLTVFNSEGAFKKVLLWGLDKKQE